MTKRDMLETFAFSASSMGSMIAGALFLIAEWTWHSTPYVEVWMKNLLVDSLGVVFLIGGLTLFFLSFALLSEDE